jgi:hypothetical protein
MWSRRLVPTQDDTALLAEAWTRIEQSMLDRANGGKISFQAGEAELLVDAVRRAVRIEVQTCEDATKYVAVFDANSQDGQGAAKYLGAKLEKLEQAVRRHTPHRIRREATEVRLAPLENPIEGEVCPRLMSSLRGTPWPDTGLPLEWGGP